MTLVVKIISVNVEANWLERSIPLVLFRFWIHLYDLPEAVWTDRDTEQELDLLAPGLFFLQFGIIGMIGAELPYPQSGIWVVLFLLLLAGFILQNL